MKAVAIAFMVWIGGTCQSSAQHSGNDIKDSCQFSLSEPRGELQLAKATFCQGFVGAILFVGDRFAEPYKFCPPAGVTIGQAIRVLFKYLDENPDKTHRAKT